PARMPRRPLPPCTARPRGLGRAGAAGWGDERRPSGHPRRDRPPRRRRVRSTPARRAGPECGQPSRSGRMHPAKTPALTPGRTFALAPARVAALVSALAMVTPALATACAPAAVARAAGAGGPGVHTPTARPSVRRSGARAAAGPDAAPTRYRPRSRAGESAAMGKDPALRRPRPGNLPRRNGGLEARAARAAVARLGRAQGPASWL